MALKKEAGLERRDVMLTFGETQAIAAAGTFPFGYTAAATDGVIIDTNGTDLDGMTVVITVETAAAGAAQTFNLLARKGTSADFATIATTGAIAASALPAGKVVKLPIPRDGAYNQYKLQVVGAASTSAGKYSAYVDTYVGV